MNLKRPILIVVLAVWATLPLTGCSQDNPQSRAVAGLWESTYRGIGGQANSLVLSGDSLLQRVYLLAFDFRFSAWGDSLKLERLIRDSLGRLVDTAAPTLVLRYEVRGDTLIRDEPHRVEYLVRKGQAPGDPQSLIGTWVVVRSTDSANVNALARFLPDSTLQVRLKVSAASGIYRTTRDSIVFLVEADTGRCAFSLRADTLAVTRTFTNGTFTFTYLRGGPDLWY